MSKLEVDEEGAVKKWCKEHNVLFIKFTPFGEKGWPDRICIFPDGRHVWLEMKRKGKKPRKLQRYRLDILIKQECNVAWADSAAGAIRQLELFL